MFCKHKRDESWVSRRLDAVVAYSEGRIGTPNALAGEEDSLILWLEGYRIELERPISNPGDPNVSRTHWFEPIESSPFSGRVRVYWNRLADGNQGGELRAYMQTENENLNDDENDHYADAWTVRHKLTGISYAHIVLNLKDGINGNINRKRDSINRIRITGPPRNFIFQFPGLAGLSIPDGTPLNIEVTSNSIVVFGHWVTTVLGLDQDLFLPGDVFIAFARAEANQNIDITRERVSYSFSGPADNRVVEPTVTTITSTVDVKPFDFNGIIKGNDDPVRVFQMFETLWGQKIGFQGGKILPIVGRHETNLSPNRTINEEDLWQDPHTVNNPELSDRANAIGGQLHYCVQSESNSSYPIPRANNVELNVEDRLFIERNLPTATCINDFYQAQQLTRTRAILLERRREVVLPAHYTNERASWQQGEKITVNLPNSGINNKIFVIEAMAYVPENGLIFYCTEQTEDDPWEITTDPPFFLFSEDRIPREVDIGAIPPPDRIEVTREDITLNNQAVSWINVEFNDPEYAELRLEIEWDAVTREGTTDPYAFRSSFSSIPPARFQVEGHGTVYFRLRWRLDEDTTSAWTREFNTDENRILPQVDLVTGLAVIPGGTEADLLWYPAEFIGFAKTQIRYGTGDEVGTDAIGEPIDVESPGDHLKITGLETETSYWAQARFFNSEDITTEWDGSSRTVAFTAHATGYSFTFTDTLGTDRTATYRGIFANQDTAEAAITDPALWDIYRDEALDQWRIYTGGIWIEFSLAIGVGNFAGDFPDQNTAEEAIIAQGQFVIYPNQSNDKTLYEVTSFEAGSPAAPHVLFTTTGHERFVFDPTTEYIPGLKKNEPIGTVPPFQLAAAIGGSGDITYEIDNTLISGLSGIPTDTQFHANTRRITGTPTVAAEFNFGYKATDQSDPPRSITRIITVQVQADEADFAFGRALYPPEIIKGKEILALDAIRMPTATRNGEAIDDATYSVESGLPNGLNFTPASRYITGTPTVAGNFDILYKVVDNSDSAEYFERFEFKIDEAADSFTFGRALYPPEIVKGKEILATDAIRMPTATRNGEAIDNPTYSVESGLPSGLNFTAASRYITGTPTVAGNFDILYKVIDTSDNAEYFERFEFKIDEAFDSFTFGRALYPPEIIKGREILATDAIRMPTATRNGEAIDDATYSVESGLPRGLNFTPASRYITGTPTVAGNFDILYKVVDNSDSAEYFERFEFKIDEAFDSFAFGRALYPPEIIKDREILATDAIRMPTATRNGEAIDDATYSVESGLPGGLNFTPASRYITGTPTVAGNFDILYKVVDNSDSAEYFERFEFKIDEAITIFPKFPRGYDSYGVNVNDAANHNFPSASITSGETLSYVLSPSLPSGMSFQAGTPSLSGTPTTVGPSVHALIARVASDHSRFAELLFTLNVRPPPPNYDDQSDPLL